MSRRSTTRLFYVCEWGVHQRDLSWYPCIASELPAASVATSMVGGVRVGQGSGEDIVDDKVDRGVVSLYLLFMFWLDVACIRVFITEVRKHQIEKRIVEYLLYDIDRVWIGRGLGSRRTLAIVARRKRWSSGHERSRALRQMEGDETWIDTTSEKSVGWAEVPGHGQWQNIQAFALARYEDLCKLRGEEVRCERECGREMRAVGQRKMTQWKMKKAQKVRICIGVTHNESTRASQRIATLAIRCMRTRSQARNRNRRQQITPVIVEEPEIPMADNRTMAQMLQAPIEGYEDAIVTSTFRHPDVPNTSIKLLLFPFSLEGEARIWLDKEPPRSILTWDDLVSKFINQFFPPSKTTYLRNEIINFLQKPNETFNEAWERFKGLLRQLSTNAPLSTSTPSNSFEFQQLAASLEDKMDIRMSRLEKMISEKNVTTPATVKAVEEVCVTCGSNHNFNNCPLTRNDFPVFHDNIHQFQQTAAVGNFVQRNPPNLANQMRPPGFNVQNNQGNQSRYQGNNFNSNQNRGNNFNHQNNQGQVFQPPTNQPPVYQVPPYQAPTSQIQGVSKTDFENYVKANDAVLKNVQNHLQLNTASTSRSGTLPSQTVTNPREHFQTSPQEAVKLVKDLQPLFREARRSENFVYPVLSELNRTSTLADSGASINLLPHSIYKQLGLEALTPARMTLELANRSVMHPMGIVEDVVVSVDGFTFLADFVVVNFEPDPRVHFILGRPFLRTAKALIDLYEENLTLRIGKEELVYYADKSKKNKDKHFVHAISVIDFSKDDPFSGSTTTHSKWILLLVLLPVKTSDNFEKFADELCSTLICDHRLVCFFAPEDILEIDAFLAIEVSSKFEDGYFDLEGDVTYLDNLLSDDTTHNLVSEVIFDHEPEQNESLITLSPKSDPLHHEFTGEVITLPSRNDCEFREYLSLMTVICEISTSRSQENVHQSSVIESLPVSPIPVEDSDPVQEEIDIFRVSDDLILPGVENDDSEDEDN
ncbi:reverse transcriptase domain-containing protein [Tanacetum coccineum]